MLEKDFSPQYDGRGGDAAQNHKHLNEMPIDEMTDRLSELLDSIDETTFDPAQLDALLAGMEELEPISPEIDVEASLAYFHEKHARLFEQAMPAKKHYKNKPVRRHFLRAALVAAVAIALMLCSMITVQALGFNLFGVIAQWTDDVFHFSVSGNEDLDSDNVPVLISNTTCKTLQDTLTVYGIHEAIAPNWFPDSFVITEIDVSNFAANMVISADYETSGKHISIAIREFLSEEDAKIALGSFEKDSREVIPYNKCDIIHYMFSNNSCSTATWVNGAFACSISGDLTMDELKKMVDSIYEGGK